jgi:tetratricopeptide (TPR) repeat protein
MNSRTSPMQNVISYFMRAFIFLNLFFLSVSVLGQTSVDQIMAKATCDCITIMLNPNDKDNEAFNKCFCNSIGKDTALLKKECKLIYGDTTSESLYKFGNDFFKRNSVNLVYTCDAYYKIIDSTRDSQINSLNKDSLRSSLESLNQTDPKTWDKDFLVKRGLFYFALADYDNSIKDLDASLNIDPNTIQSLFFKAWIFEIQKNFEGAIKLYSDLGEITKTNDFNIFAAMAKRKKNSL